MVNVLLTRSIIWANHNQICHWLLSIHCDTCTCSRNLKICTNRVNWRNSWMICIVVNCIVNSIMVLKSQNKAQKQLRPLNDQRMCQNRRLKNWHRPKIAILCYATNYNWTLKSVLKLRLYNPRYISEASIYLSNERMHLTKTSTHKKTYTHTNVRYKIPFPLLYIRNDPMFSTTSLGFFLLDKERWQLVVLIHQAGGFCLPWRP